MFLLIPMSIFYVVNGVYVGLNQKEEGYNNEIIENGVYKMLFNKILNHIELNLMLVNSCENYFLVK